LPCAAQDHLGATEAVPGRFGQPSPSVGTDPYHGNRGGWLAGVGGRWFGHRITLSLSLPRCRSAAGDGVQ
jgi:hypothetical protein